MGLIQELGRRQPQHHRIPAVDALCGRLSLQFADPGCLGGGSLEEETTILMRTSGNVPRNTNQQVHVWNFSSPHRLQPKALCSQRTADARDSPVYIFF